MSALIIGILLTVGILLLSLLTISKGYGYKHTVDPLVEENKEESTNNNKAVKGNL
ncbi:YtzI protein [Pseudogracilibacillus auburnensis]|nr:YtzI protein [Pseudogracilibacillus auburnensis]MBO1002354.1 YtzI protein [Pseudogracilibacillus auburnensis]